jgi:hypothetical protein
MSSNNSTNLGRQLRESREIERKASSIHCNNSRGRSSTEGLLSLSLLSPPLPSSTSHADYLAAVPAVAVEGVTTAVDENIYGGQEQGIPPAPKLLLVLTTPTANTNTNANDT